MFFSAAAKSRVIFPTVAKRAVAQLGSALRSGRRGRGFKSRQPDIRISPFDAAKRRHTSFASVDVMPELTEDRRKEYVKLATNDSHYVRAEMLLQQDAAIYAKINDGATLDEAVIL